MSTYKPLKADWRKCVLEWSRNHLLEEVTKKGFASLFNWVLSTSLGPQIIISGFKTCELYPRNLSAIKFNICLDKEKHSTKF